jgi:hypothetical protein
MEAVLKQIAMHQEDAAVSAGSKLQSRPADGLREFIHPSQCQIEHKSNIFTAN